MTHPAAIVPPVILALLFAACFRVVDTEQADRDNQEAMASLPVHPAAILVGTEVGDHQIRSLTYHYATTTTTSEVEDFYVENLTDLGWELRASESGVPLAFFKDHTAVILRFEAPGALAQATPMASTPARDALLFQITVVAPQ